VSKKARKKTDGATVLLMVTRREARILVDNVSAQDPRTRGLHGRVMRALVEDEDRTIKEAAVQEVLALTSPRKEREEH
jgi:hypothetical protein